MGIDRVGPLIKPDFRYICCQQALAWAMPTETERNVGIDQQSFPGALLCAISGFPCQFVSYLIPSFPLLSCIDPGLTDRLEAFKNNATPRNDWQELALDIRKLRKSLTDATSFLAAYDQRQYQAVSSPHSKDQSNMDSRPDTANGLIRTDVGRDSLCFPTQDEVHIQA